MIIEDETAVPCLMETFGSEVRHLREAAGLTQTQLAKAVFATQAAVSYMENADRLPSREVIVRIDRALDGREALVRLYPAVRAHPHALCRSSLLAMEATALAVRSFECAAIPPLLQTEAYARAVLAAVRPRDVGRLVEARRARQRSLERLPHAWFVVDEAALRRTVGGPAVMREQLRRLLAVGQDPRHVLQVIPERAGESAGMTASPFTLLDLDAGPTVVVLNGPASGHLLTAEAEVRQARHLFDLLRADALSARESAAVIQSHRSRLTPVGALSECPA